MDLLTILLIVITVLLVLSIILQVISRKSSDTNSIQTLIKRSAEEQRNTVQKQLDAGTTQQFERFGLIQENIQKTLSSNREEANGQFYKFHQQIETKLNTALQTSMESNDKIGNTVSTALQASREEQTKQFQLFEKQLTDRLSNMQQANTNSIEKINSTLESRMKTLQESNEKRLEQMQNVVDEKLQKTLETRLTQSFDRVSKQLESVDQGLGEMKALAADTKSLKDALTNVKERGTYGEVRLEKLLSDILAPGQYESNIEIENGKRVEFAVKLPGNGDEPLFLPIDSKFPIEDYNRLIDARDKTAIDSARQALTTAIRHSAKEIHDKYIAPPKTTDFALMFLPTEGLYAEVVQNASLFEELRDKYKVTAVGATTLSAFLASLQMGFSTLAIQKQSQEVWKTLRGVKSEFAKFGKHLEKAQKQLHAADKTLGEIAGVRTRAIDRKLRAVELPSDEDDAQLPSSEESLDD